MCKATVHYLARMIEAGEDPNFIARRIVICAAEDVGLADPQALILANAAAQAAPYGRVFGGAHYYYLRLRAMLLSHLKSNSAYVAIDAAISDVRHRDCGQVPDHLKDSHYSGG